MTRLVVVSDSHGNPAALRRAIASVPDANAVFFLGDGIRDLLQVREEFPGLRFYPVAGNCDFQRSYPTEGLVPFEGRLIFYTHGHLYGVALGGRSSCSSPARTAGRTSCCSATPTGRSSCPASGTGPPP